MRTRTWTDEQFIDSVKQSESIAGVLKRLGLQITGANYKTVKLTVKRLNLDTSHWTGQGHLKGRKHGWSKKQSLEDILVRNSSYVNTVCLKQRLLKDNIFTYQCSECRISKWNDKPLVLQLDHINGIHDDNRIENLRLLCPNCHSQTDTFAAKKHKNQ